MSPLVIQIVNDGMLLSVCKQVLCLASVLCPGQDLWEAAQGPCFCELRVLLSFASLPAFLLP